MSERFDLVIRNGTVVDGTRAPRYAADVAVSGGRIARIGALAGARGAIEIDATGKIVAPGFIDAHTHDDRLMLSAPDMAPKVSQGVTTVVAGNCGISLAPLPRRHAAAGHAAARPARRRGRLVPVPDLRRVCRGARAQPRPRPTLRCWSGTPRCASPRWTTSSGRPHDDEIRRMREMAREALAAGAIGVSTGLYYEPAAAAPTEEVIEVCRPLARARRALLHAHARRGRPRARVARRDASASAARSACRWSSRTTR